MTSSLRPITCVSPLEWLKFGCVASFRRGRGPFLDLVVLSARFELIDETVRCRRFDDCREIAVIIRLVRHVSWTTQFALA
jgi:hypothetical protein